jgi:hypothetical protein
MSKPFQIKATPAGVKSQSGRKAAMMPQEVLAHAEKEGEDVTNAIRESDGRLDWEPGSAPKESLSPTKTGSQAHKQAPLYPETFPWPEARPLDESAVKAHGPHQKPFRVK